MLPAKYLKKTFLTKEKKIITQPFLELRQFYVKVLLITNNVEWKFSTFDKVNQKTGSFDAAAPFYFYHYGVRF